MLLKTISNRSAWKFFYKLFYEMFQTLRFVVIEEIIIVHLVNISNVVSLHFWRHSLWKLGFQNASEVNFKQGNLTLLL
jgi:hypothetical protein